ncbi:MAG: site-specific DNA-methyltransferase [Bacteroidales bacterium]|nr:site-specific DNA-methyltransferase [Bacteroidales bacterium]
MEHIGNIHLYNEDVAAVYHEWDSPVVIISDGPYGISGYKGDLSSYHGLAQWYESHIAEWTKKATPMTTLWFWNTEIGWAVVHPMLEKYGWEFKTCNIWDKGMSHVAGNTNTKTISHLPVVTEVCAQYVMKPMFHVNGETMTMKEWLRYEWARTGLPFSRTNVACGVVDAATRKYFTKCHLWYMPPSEMFGRIVRYANIYGKPSGRPYFSVDGHTPLTEEEWQTYRPKFHCPMGVTNVWNTVQLRSRERLKNGFKAFHLNQKPLTLIQRIIEISSDPNDVVWDPFGGMFTTAVASILSDRTCFTAEITPEVYQEGLKRILSYTLQNRLQFTSQPLSASFE